MLKRNMTLACLLGTVVCCVCLLTACSSSAPTPSTPTPPECPANPQGLPGLPDGAHPHEANVSGGLIQTGDAFLNFSGGTLAPGLAKLDSSTAPSGVSWALYLFPEPLTPAYTLEVQAEYVDPDPFSADPRDGYWLACGNYNTAAWEFYGPFTQSITRVFIEPGVDVVNAVAQVPILVLCENGNAVDVMAVRLGEDIGYGYEELSLAGPPGSFAGRSCDLQVDSAGNPQVLYTVSQGMQSIGYQTERLRIARLNGTDWELEDLDLGAIEHVRWSQFALGDGGRRAVLVREHIIADDLHLFYDDGTGFTNIGIVSPTAMKDSYGGLAFVNKDGIATGPRDRLLIAYTVQTVNPDVQTYYRTYNGVSLALQLPVFPGITRECGRISLSAGPDNNGIVGVPDFNGVDWLYNVGLYDAVANTWDFLAVAPWTAPTEPECNNYDYHNVPDFSVRQTAAGEFVAGYIDKDFEFLRFGRYNGAIWLSTSADRIPNAEQMIDNSLDFDVYASGQAATLTAFGLASPQLSYGFVGTGTSWFRSYLSHVPWSMLSYSIAIDGSDNTHMTLVDFAAGTFEYYHRDASTHEITSQTIDNGGGDRGGAFAFVHSVLYGDQLHLFYADGANHRIVRSVVENGIWLVENEPLTSGFAEWPFYVMGAGYLENSGLLYVAYMDYLTFSIKMLTGTPWGDNWETHEFATMMFEVVSITDDETNVGALGFTGFYGGQSCGFACGDPRTGPHPKETVSMSDSHISMPFHLAYNKFNGQWCVGCGAGGEKRANYFLRTPLGSWVGPFIVAEELGATAHIDVGGININQDNGTVRICVESQPDGNPVKEVWIYSAPNGSATFTGTQHLMSIDTATHDYNGLLTTSTANGEPLVAALYKPIADQDLDVRFFAPTAPDTWSSIGLWGTDLSTSYPSMLVDDTGGIFFSAIEMEGADSGTLYVRYPW